MFVLLGKKVIEYEIVRVQSLKHKSNCLLGDKRKFYTRILVRKVKKKMYASALLTGHPILFILKTKKTMF